MHLTISQCFVRARWRRICALGLVWIVVSTAPIGAQPADRPADDPFGRRGWHLQLAAHGAFETWNYNASREEMLAVVPGLTYGLRDGLTITTTWPLYHVWQRGTNGFLIGATIGVRGRVYRRQAFSIFLEFDVGVSQADTYLPPRGTRFNYLALGGGGATVRLRSGLHLLGGMRWIHVSNNGLAGRDRNPDIEAIGPQVGLLIGF